MLLCPAYDRLQYCPVPAVNGVPLAVVVAATLDAVGVPTNAYVPAAQTTHALAPVALSA